MSMKTNVWSWGDPKPQEVEHEHGECAFCLAAHGSIEPGQVIFLHGDDGKLRRVECLVLFTYGCSEVTYSQAWEEVRASREGGGDS